jgi:hypothetical protein
LKFVCQIKKQISHFKFFIWPLLQRATLNFPSIKLAKSLKVGKGGLPPPSSPGAIRLSELFRLATEQYHQTMTNEKFEMRNVKSSVTSRRQVPI